MFSDIHSDISIIIELLNRDDSISDVNAASYYFHELAQDNEVYAFKIVISHSATSSDPFQYRLKM